MSVRIKSIHLFEFSDDYKMGLKDYSGLYKNGIPLKELLENKNYETDIKSGRTPSKFRVEYWDGDYDFITLTDVNTDIYTLNPDTEEKITDAAIEECSDLVLVPKGSLLISNAMTVGLAFIVDRDVYINQNVFWVKLDETKVNKKYLLWYFNCVIKDLFDNVFSSKYLSKKELSRICVPDIDIKEQNKIVDSIVLLEKKILKYTNLVNDETSIIDDVLREKFAFNYEKFEQLKKINSYSLKQSSFANNRDLRFSVKYHRPAGNYVIKQLSGITNKKIKHFLAEPIVLGSSITPSDFDEKGKAYYVSMDTIKTLKVILDDSQTVSNEFYETKKAKSIKKGDIIVARSGVAIGKTALIEEDFEGIFADFTMRIRLDGEKYNPQFAYYYFRSTYFQYLIEIYKKGLQNPNIFPIVMQEFPIPNESLLEQQRIIDEIHKKTKKQDDIRKKITLLRGKIKNIINDRDL